jgi:hypothetical protein
VERDLVTAMILWLSALSATLIEMEMPAVSAAVSAWAVNETATFSPASH